MQSYGVRTATIAAAILFALAAAAPSLADGKHHQVGPGETLWGLASLYRSTVEVLVKLNSIANPDLIIAGQTLEVPDDGNAQTASPAAPDGDAVYEIHPGDTLSAISLRFNVSTQVLQAANRLANPDLIIAGQKLTIPGAPQTSVPIVPTPLLPPVSPEIENVIAEAAAAEGVDAKLVKAIAWVESGWDQGAVSPAGAVGIMQITPWTAAWLEEEVFGQPLNEDTSLYDNVKAGTRLLRILMNATGNVELALAAYYQGLAPTQAGLIYQETVGYVQAVLAVKARFWP